MIIGWSEYIFINEIYHSHFDRYYVSCHKDWEYRRYPRAVWVWMMKNKSEVPKGYLIHHKDKQRHNDMINNLQLVSRAEHNKLHAEDSNRFMFRKWNSFWSHPKSNKHKAAIKQAHIERVLKTKEQMSKILVPAIINNPWITLLECSRLVDRSSVKFFYRVFKQTFTLFKKELLCQNKQSVSGQTEKNTSDRSVKS